MYPEEEAQKPLEGEEAGALNAANGVAEQALRMILLVALVKGGVAQPESEEEEEEMFSRQRRLRGGGHQPSFA